MASGETASEKQLNFVHYVPDVDLSLDALPAIDWREKRSLSVFQTRIAEEMSGCFCSELWSRFMLLVAMHESAVRHAIIALSTLYEQYFDTLHGPHTGQSDFAIEHYVKAIQEVLRLNRSNEAQAIDVALLDCIVFSTLEALQGHYQSASTHIRSGLHLLAEHDGDSAAVTQGVYVPRILFRQLFVRMETQAREMGNFVVPSSPPKLNKCLRRMPHAFSSLAQATLAMSSYLNRLLLFLQDADISTPSEGATSEDLDQLVQRRRLLVDGYYGYCDAFKGMSLTGIEKQSEVLILRLYTVFVGIILRVDLNAGEVGFDDFDQDFQDVVMLASQFISHSSVLIPNPQLPDDRTLLTVQMSTQNVSSTSSPSLFPPETLSGSSHIWLGIHPKATPVCPPAEWQGTTQHVRLTDPRPLFPKPGTIYRPTYSMSLGVIAPLFATAVRCRNPIIRRQALQILLMCNRKEGLWDSIISAKVAERVICIEETHLFEERQDRCVGRIPEHARIRQLEASFFDPRRGRLRYMKSGLCPCSIARSDGADAACEQYEELIAW